MQVQRSLCFGSMYDGIVLQPVDVPGGVPWRLGMEDVVVHVSTAARPVPANRDSNFNTIWRSPAALLVGNADMPAGSLTHVRSRQPCDLCSVLCIKCLQSAVLLHHPGALQHLTLAVSGSYFINPTGAAVVWSPAVPGTLTRCTVRENASTSKPYLPSCTPGKEAGSWAQAVPDFTQHVPSSLLVADGQDLASGPSDSVVGMPPNAVPVTAPASKHTSGKLTMAQLHIHVPPEAYQMVVAVEGVRPPGQFSMLEMHLVPAYACVQCTSRTLTQQDVCRCQA
jgi:hypothetical protein